MVEKEAKKEGLLDVASLNGHVSRHVSGIVSKVTLATSPEAPLFSLSNSAVFLNGEFSPRCKDR